MNTISKKGTEGALCGGNGMSTSKLISGGENACF
jgi:hypothetical protein